MDTVEGLKSDSKCILTLFWRKSNFMLMFLLENQTTDEVTKVFEYLQETLLEENYKNLFQVILTDNGHKFIRYVLPKKTTFKNLTQNDCDIIANHINSLCRESLNNNCPFKAMLFLCDKKVLNSLNMYYIEPDEVKIKKIFIRTNYRYQFDK